jgi:serine phosphatase RsbU (regulator of sigma subunit)
VTRDGVRGFLETETREVFHFFTRDVDFAPLKSRPWYKRLPSAAWRIFLAVAHRLSPPRRILFAISVPLLFFGWAWYMLSSHDLPYPTLVAGTLLLVLLVMELKDKLTLKGDLEIAKQIQFGLLPFEPRSKEGTTIHVAMRPANTVGGDYFDVIDLGVGTALVVGDVAGKGMPAALLMALLQGSLRTLVTAGLRGSELISKLNVHLCANIPSNRLITLFYGELDGGRLKYVNAGHNAPFLLRRGGAVERLPATGVALGVIREAAFATAETRIESGDRLVLFTDGVTEASNGQDEEYGEERLVAFLSALRASGPEELIEGLIADVLHFCGNVHTRDDMTLMVVDREG